MSVIGDIIPPGVLPGGGGGGCIMETDNVFLLSSAKTRYWCCFNFFHVISMLQKNCVLKEHFIRVMQKGIVRSRLPENFKLLTLPVLEIWSIMCSQNGHL